MVCIFKNCRAPYLAESLWRIARRVAILPVKTGSFRNQAMALAAAVPR
jgi:hypothetical protein